MPELHSLVCVKVVPKPEEIRVDPNSHMLMRINVRSEINPPDMNALEMALSLKDRFGGRVSILSMGPPMFEPYLRAALAMSCDQIILLSDRQFAGADTLATTYTLARGIRKIGDVDLVFCGEESSDGATGQVPAGLAEWLDMPLLSLLGEIEPDLTRGICRGRREIKGGYEILETEMPCVVSVKTAANEPRFIDFQRKSWAFDEYQPVIWNATDLETDPAFVGLQGSPTEVTGLAEATTRQRKGIFLGTSVEEISDQLAQLLRDLI